MSMAVFPQTPSFTGFNTPSRIEADIADGQRYGVRGTPHFFINGKPINGAQPFEVFKTSIDEELAKPKS